MWRKKSYSGNSWGSAGLCSHQYVYDYKTNNKICVKCKDGYNESEKIKRNKFNAVKTEYKNEVYDSGLEARYAYELNIRKQQKEIKDWSRQEKIDLYFYNSRGEKINYKSYKVDFMIYENDGTFTLVEVKGVEGIDWLWKKTILEKVWIVDNPNYRYIVKKEKDIR